MAIKIWMHPVHGQLVCIMVMNVVLECNLMIMTWDNKKFRRKVKEREKQRRKVREEEEEATREKKKTRKNTTKQSIKILFIKS